RLSRRHGTARVRNHAQPDQTLARRLARPERLERREVAVIKKEAGEDQHGEGPGADRRHRERGEPRRGERAETERDEAGHLQRRVDREREEAVADPRERELQRNLLRRLDDKLVRWRASASPREGWTRQHATGT